MDHPTPQVLRELLRYEPETGKLFWLPRPRNMFRCDKDFRQWNAKNANREALTADTGRGYRRGRVLFQSVRAHRAIWAMQTGQWPEDVIDHINGNGMDNRWANLRAASKSQNSHNARRRTDNKTGVKGVTKIANAQKWRAEIRVGGRGKYLGVFNCVTAAAIAYARASAELHGEFGRIA